MSWFDEHAEFIFLIFKIFAYRSLINCSAPLLIYSSKKCATFCDILLYTLNSIIMTGFCDAVHIFCIAKIIRAYICKVLYFMLFILLLLKWFSSTSLDWSSGSFSFVAVLVISLLDGTLWLLRQKSHPISQLEMLHEVTGLSILCVCLFPLSQSHWGGSGRSASLLLPWMRNDMFCQLLMWLRLELLCCLVIWWCPGGELVAYLHPGWLGHVHYKLQMNSSTCSLNSRSGGCFFTLLNIILLFWKALELRFRLELLMSSHCLRMQSGVW